MNDGINPDLCSLSYVSIDDAARAVAKAGRGALLAKPDIKSAYRILEIHPEDHPLLGMLWDGAVHRLGLAVWSLLSPQDIYGTG